MRATRTVGCSVWDSRIRVQGLGFRGFTSEFVAEDVQESDEDVAVQSISPGINFFAFKHLPRNSRVQG